MTAALNIPQAGRTTHGPTQERALDWALWLSLKADGPLPPHGITLGRKQALDLSAMLRRAARILKEVPATPQAPNPGTSLKHAPRLDVNTPEGVQRETWIKWFDRMAVSERHHMKLSKRAATELARLLRDV